MRYSFFVLTIFLSANISAQVLKHEVGIAGGGSYYLGDINHLTPFYKVRPVIGLLYRYTQHDNVAIKAQVSRLQIEAYDSDFSNTYQQLRNASFNTGLWEVAGMFEFNFKPYNPPERLNFAPYITFGTALVYAENLEDLDYFLTFPFGGGFKAALSKRLTFNMEWVFRNAMNDKLDNIIPAEAEFPQKQTSAIYTNDWYSSAQLSFTYNFSGTKKWCPAYPKSVR